MDVHNCTLEIESSGLLSGQISQSCTCSSKLPQDSERLATELISSSVPNALRLQHFFNQ